MTYGWNGWSGRTVRWRYNDANRPAALVASATAAVDRINAAMNKWSAVCNIRFVYDGATTNAPSLATGGGRDGVNVIAWAALTGNTTGVTYIGASGLSGGTLTLDEGDMQINYQFNPVLDATLVHEVGHFIGIQHSNIEGTVMSGPNTAPNPSTAYTSLAALQPDDIAGCQSLYGAAGGVTPTPVPVFTASSSTLGFAGTTVGTASATQSVTVTNTGNAALTISSANILGADFTLLSNTCIAGASIAPGATCLASVRFAPTAVGTRLGGLTLAHNAIPASTTISFVGTGLAAAAAAKRSMVEYRFAALDYYFITSQDNEKTSLDAMSGWARTGASFLVLAAQESGTRGVTRYYFDRVARSASRGSHFYTLLDGDIAALNAQNPSRSTAPGLPQNETVDSYAYLPVVSGVGGSCAGGLLPVYRLFRGAVRFPDDPNHRFTTNVPTYNAFVAQGWTGEGVNFCVPAS